MRSWPTSSGSTPARSCATSSRPSWSRRRSSSSGCAPVGQHRRPLDRRARPPRREHGWETVGRDSEVAGLHDVAGRGRCRHHVVRPARRRARASASHAWSSRTVADGRRAWLHGRHRPLLAGRRRPAAVAVGSGAARPRRGGGQHRRSAHRPDSGVGESPEGQAFRTWESIARRVLAPTAQGPVLVVLEDLHWADTATLRVLRHLVATAADEHLAVVVTRRPFPTPTGALAEAAEELARRHVVNLEPRRAGDRRVRRARGRGAGRTGAW